MTARLKLLVGNLEQTAYVPLHDERGRPLGDEVVLTLLRTSVVDLFYYLEEDISRHPACPTCGMQDCHGGHVVYSPRHTAEKE